ncbi:hypothetical protein ACFQMA_03450 [Halosimplex aquaticum]|uniref:Tic20-like protein n=1 Tax=Halosimplex aquaticum TaxID=3026162 RepID=A0ABD5XY43_9EURY|nr:hypothetical protein [Halosimplex aquaticum]
MGDEDERAQRRRLAALSYLLMPVSGLVVRYATDPGERDEFHALQSVFLGVGLLLLFPVAGFVGELYFSAAIAVWVVAMLTAYNGMAFEFPIAGPLARERT